MYVLYVTRMHVLRKERNLLVIYQRVCTYAVA